MKKLYKLFKDGNTIAQILFWTLLFICVGLLIVSFFIPPVGTISKSAIIATSEVMGFASVGSALAAINTGINVKATKGDLTIETVAKNEIPSGFKFENKPDA